MTAKKSFTLIELSITIVFFVILSAVVFYFFRAVLISWSNSEKRAGIDIGVDRAAEEFVRDIREARQLSIVNTDEIRFTKDGSNFYIYYFFNSGDTYPPSFSQSLYELRKAALTGGISGSFTYSSGDIIIADVLPPPTSDLSLSSNMVIIDLSINRADETIRTRTQVRPRNI